jgi:hypothetical protein
LDRPTQNEPDGPSPPSDARVSSPLLDSPADSEDDVNHGPPVRPPGMRPRRLSTYESADGVLDLESDRVGGSARQR